MKISNPWMIVCAVTTVLTLQVATAMFFEISSLKRELRLAEKSKQIADDQIDELMYMVSNLRNEKDSISTQQFVAGVVDTINNKDYYNSVWHDGYNRGSNVAEYTTRIEIENKK